MGEFVAALAVLWIIILEIVWFVKIWFMTNDVKEIKKMMKEILKNKGE